MLKHGITQDTTQTEECGVRSQLGSASYELCTGVILELFLCLSNVHVIKRHQNTHCATHIYNDYYTALHKRPLRLTLGHESRHNSHSILVLVLAVCY